MTSTALESEVLCNITIKSIGGEDIFTFTCAHSTVGELKLQIAKTGHSKTTSSEIRLLRPGRHDLCEDCEQLKAVNQTFILLQTHLSVDNASLRQAVALYRTRHIEFKSQYGSLGSLDVSQVTDMSELFEGIPDGNLPIEGWDTSNVVNMADMFADAQAFNADISQWDTSKVTNMHGMFMAAAAFNADISQWDTSKVTSMNGMFMIATAFNADISQWDTSKVTDMAFMFTEAHAFNADISQWDISKVTNMTSMFSDTQAFNADISQWDTSKVTNMNGMLMDAAAFNADISQWDTSKVTDMAYIYKSVGEIIFGDAFESSSDSILRDAYTKFLNENLLQRRDNGFSWPG